MKNKINPFIDRLISKNKSDGIEKIEPSIEASTFFLQDTLFFNLRIIT